MTLSSSAVCSSFIDSEQPEVFKMQLIVRSADSTFVVSVPEGASVQDLKAAIENVDFVPAGELYEHEWERVAASLLTIHWA